MAMLTSFPYLAHSSATTLILGSMPGIKSLDENQYYAHPRNAFWKIMSSVLGFDINLSYPERCQQLTQNNIALWDVMQHCERDGSLDSAIIEDSIVPNNFHQFFEKHPRITHIGFNGRKAEHAFQRYVLPELIDSHTLEFTNLPSTSPAYASMKFEEKLAIWSKYILN